MSMGWPRWIAFLALTALTWWGLSLLSPDRVRLSGFAYDALAHDLAAHPGMVALTKDGNEGLLVSSLEVDGGDLCEGPLRDVLDLRFTPEGRPLLVRCTQTEGRASLSAQLGDQGAIEVSRSLASSLSLMPPLMAIFFAFLFKQVGLALLGGIFIGAWVYVEFDVAQAVLHALTGYLWGTLIDPFNLYVFGFTLVLIGMVNISIAMGGMAGVINSLQVLARGPRSTQVVTALMGFFVFFDDYANTVVVGGAARPLTDSHRISRAKLAYLVDSTAAPIAGIAIVSTWIGIEINYFQGALDQIGPPLNAVADGGYDFFFQSLPYRFYCFFALALVFLVSITGRDFGPMVAAERWARAHGSKTPEQSDDPRLREARESVAHVRVKGGVPCRWQNGVFPIVVVIIVVILGSIQSGSEAILAAGGTFDWTDFGQLGAAFTKVQDSVQVLFIAAIVGTIAATLLAVSQRILTVRETFSSFSRGAIAMLPAIWILILAMAIRTVAKDLQAAHFLAALLGDVSPLWLPLVSFMIAGGVAFATGTSWGTMAILVPVCLPLTAELAAGMPEAPLLLFLVGASVLDGAIFGDHCSLISDTTVMSSIATGCEHVEHVRTQIPYATLAMLVAAFSGYGLTALLGGQLFWVSYPIGVTLMLGWLWLRGTRTDASRALGG